MACVDDNAVHGNIEVSDKVGVEENDAVTMSLYSQVL